MKHFDDNGNFVPTPKPEPIEEQFSYFISNLPVVYFVKETKEEKGNPSSPDGAGSFPLSGGN